MATVKPATFTAGDMRKLLLQNKATWTVASTLADTDTAPQHSLGAKTDGLMLASQAPKLNLQTTLSSVPNNPFLQERRLDLGLIKTTLTPTGTTTTPATSQLLNLLLAKPTSVNLAPLKSVGQVSGASPSTMVDWTNRWGGDWITRIRDQDGCEACWAFAHTALIEAMTRINHYVWCIRSEGDVHQGMGAKCADGGNAQATMDWIQKNGLADPDCFAWTTADVPYTPTPDRSGRTVKIDSYNWVGNINDQKTWLDTTGPIATWFDVWADFDWYGSGVYHKQSTLPNGQPNYERDGHFMLVVGYDDTPGQNCWIVKNSWGTGWGMGGFGRIGYGESGIDQYAKVGVVLTNPDPWTKRRLHNGSMIESGDGADHRNFELVSTGPGNQVVHWWRDNSTAGFPWHQAEKFGNDAFACPTLTGTTFNRNFEMVYLTTSNRLHHRYFDQTSQKWGDGGVFGPTNAQGVPGFIQSNYGAPGNFEVVVKTSDGTLNHWWRDNGKSGYPWSDGGHFGKNILLSGPTLIQSNFGTKGNLELVCVLTSGQMQHWWRNNDDSKLPWAASATFGSNVESPPCMIQGEYGAANEYKPGNFELCVAVNGSVQHWWRDNSGSQQWNHSATFGSNVDCVAALIESSYDFNLEVIVVTRNNQLQHHYRDGNGNWNTGVIIGSI